MVFGTGQKKAQTMLEYVVLVVVIMAALFSMQQYVQRGIQGRWRESLDDMGRQYDPRATVTKTQTMNMTAQTTMFVQETDEGLKTFREDVTESSETIDDFWSISD